MTPLTPHDDERCARIYRACKSASVAFARRLLASSRRHRYLCIFDAEELYDTAWETYYRRKEYLDDRDDHTARLNALILSRFRDELRRSTARKRTPPGSEVDFDMAERSGATNRPGTRRPTDGLGPPGAAIEDRLAQRGELRQLLAEVRNPDDRRALVDHEVRGLTFEEIGRSEGITAEAARRRVQRAKDQARRGGGEP